MKKLIIERIRRKDKTALSDIAKKLELKNWSNLTREDLGTKIISEGDPKELQKLLGIDKFDVIKSYLPWLVIPSLLIGGLGFVLKFLTVESKYSERVENLCDFDTSHFNVLIIPLQELSDCEYKDCDPSLSIYYGLVDKVEEEKLPICVNYLEGGPDPVTYEGGRKMAARFNADLVLWGAVYESCVNDERDANLKYVLTDSLGPYFALQGQTGFKKLKNIEDVRQGCLFQEAEYIINWILGIHAFEQKDYFQALTFFKQIEDEYDSPANDLKIKMAICYHAIALYNKEGESYYVNVMTDSIGNSFSIEAAKTFQQLEDYRTSLDYYNKGIQENPSVPDFYNSRARVYGMLGMEDSAVLDFRKAIRIDPQFKHSWFNLGRHFYLKGQTDSAIYYINRTLEIDSLFYNALITKGIYHQFVKKDYDSALSAYRLSTEVKPEESLGFEYMAIIYNAKAKTDTSNRSYLDSARTYFDKTLALSPENLSAVYLNMCNFYAYPEYNFQLDSAVKYLKNSLSLDYSNCEKFKGWVKFDTLMTYDTISSVYSYYCNSSIQE